MPSSPYGPCSNGKTTSSSRPCTIALGSSSLRGVVVSAEQFDAGLAASRRACWMTSEASTIVGGRAGRLQRPSLPTKMGTGS